VSKKDNGAVEPEVLEPNQIVSEAYKSLDKQIEKLDLIPRGAQEKSDVLLDLVYDSEKDIMQDPKAQFEFIKALHALNEQIGHAFHALMEIDREHYRPQKDSSLPSLPELPMLPMQSQGQYQSAPPVVVGQPTVVKKGMFSSFWEHMSNRRWAGAYEKAVDSRQPEITTSKVIDILDYGRQLESEFSRLQTFYDKGIKRVHFFNDANTLRNQMQEIRLECVKIAGIICAFSTAITEYRKERYGDRKVGVAAGAMWLEAAKARSEMQMRPGFPVSVDPNALNMRNRVC